MQNAKLVVGLVLGTVAVVIVMAVLMSRQGKLIIDTVKIIGEAPHATGSAEAKVTVVEFSDFQCPACRSARVLTEEMMEDNSEDVRLVYRHFPVIEIHKNAQLAAEAAELVAEQGMFWQMHNLLFDRQDEWETADEVEEIFSGYAEELGVDGQGFRERLTQGEARDRVDEDKLAGREFGVNGTPTFFVNGVKVSVDGLLGEIERARAGE